MQFFFCLTGFIPRIRLSIVPKKNSLDEYFSFSQHSLSIDHFRGDVMAYIIENVNLLKGEKLSRTSLLVENGKITLMKPSLNRFRFMKMDGDSFIMTAPHVTLDTQIPFHQPFYEQKEYYSAEFIRKGCTTFLTYVNINHEFELPIKLEQFKKNLLNSPIDYVIGIKIPIRLLTARFMRECKKRKIPAVFIQIDHKDELNSVSWGWIKEALFPYNSPLIPIFQVGNDNRELKQTWQMIMLKEKISSFPDEILEKRPISENLLAKIGIFPIKASIHQGSEISYNFYEKSRELYKLNKHDLYNQHESRLCITVHKGTVIKAGKQLNFQSGFGEHIIIKIPSFYRLDDRWRGT